MLSVPNTHPPTVITAYWTVEIKTDIDRCIERFDERLRMDKERRDKDAAKNARAQKLKPAKLKQANSLKKH